MQGTDPKIAYLTLRFDAATERSIVDLWLALAEEGIELIGLSGHRPHITVSAYETDEVESYFPLLDEFGRKTAAFPLTFGAVGIFPANRVVYLAPIVTDLLRAAHHSLLVHLGGPGRPPLRHTALLPDRWMPHCTLTDGADPGTVAQIVAHCVRRWQTLEGWVEGIGIRVPPDTTDVYDVSFADRPARNEAH